MWIDLRMTILTCISFDISGINVIIFKKIKKLSGLRTFKDADYPIETRKCSINL